MEQRGTTKLSWKVSFRLYSHCSHTIQFIQGIDNLNDIGCFGLTELGYGNNAVEMETTATYDNETKEFIVHTPHPLAQVNTLL